MLVMLACCANGPVTQGNTMSCCCSNLPLGTSPCITGKQAVTQGLKPCDEDVTDSLNLLLQSWTSHPRIKEILTKHSNELSEHVKTWEIKWWQGAKVNLLDFCLNASVTGTWCIQNSRHLLVISQQNYGFCLWETSMLPPVTSPLHLESILTTVYCYLIVDNHLSALAPLIQLLYLTSLQIISYFVLML